MMISLLNNVQSDQETKARVKDTKGGAAAQDYRGPSTKNNRLSDNKIAKLKDK
jgi:hypothetical protein